jgi:hypothetical protein
MHNKIKWANKELPGLSHDDLNKLTENILSKKENGLFAATQINKNQGKKNAKSGHMKSIQKLGASIGGIISGNNKTKEEMKQISKLGNEANAQKYGKRIYATNLNTEKCWEYISIREAERDLKIQAPIIRKILRGLQPKTRCGWTFEYKILI